MNKNSRGPLALILAVSLAQIYRLYNLVNEHALNLISGDDFDDRAPLFNGVHNLFELSRYQWGPRRLGIGLWITDWVQQLTNWDNRALIFFMAALLALCLPLILWTRYRLTKSFSYWDALIPLILLNLHQWELLLFIPLNGIPMLFLFFICALLLTFQPTVLVSALFWFFSFLLLHTGYGIVAILPLAIIFFKCLFQTKKKKEALIWGTAHFLSFVFFLWGYKSQPGVACFQLPHPRPWEYLYFQALSQSFFFGFFKTTGLAGVIAGLLCIAGYALGFKLLKDKKPLDEVLIFLLFFSLSYQINAAIGRVCVGVDAGKLSRYVTFHIPQILAFLFFAQSIVKTKHRRIALGALAILVILSAVHTDRREKGIFENIMGERKAFLSCFKETKNLAACEEESGFKLYPDPSNLEAKSRMKFLEDNGLSFYGEGNSSQ